MSTNHITQAPSILPLHHLKMKPAFANMHYLDIISTEAKARTVRYKIYLHFGPGTWADDMLQSQSPILKQAADYLKIPGITF
jgi:hypothetical protein